MAFAQDIPATSDSAEAEEDAIVVTGLRASLQSAQSQKQRSDKIVDSIVAEDIGKLPDVAVSDTAARIPGIQVERRGGEASRVLVRGLDRFNYTTTYNGREIFTAETRSVALQDFPAGGISAIDVFKTSSADLVEPGIAGLINVRSRRPFDFEDSEIAGSVWGVYPDKSRDLEPNAQLLLSERWDAGDGEIGALINFSYTRMHYRDSVRRHGFFIADLAGARSPDWPEIQYAEAERWRPSINGALQWRPSPDLEFYVEGLWQGYRERATDRMWAQPLWGGASYTNLVIENGQIISGTVNTPTACCGGNHTWGFQGATKRDTNTYQFAIGGRWDAGPLRITADIARTDSTFDLRTESVDYEINTKNYSVDWFTGRPGGSGPTFQVRGIDPTNPAIYNYRGFYEDYLTASGDDWQARIDFQYEPTGIDFLPSINWGARFVNRDASSNAGDYYFNLRDRGVPISAVPLDYILQPGGFRGDNNAPFPVRWLGPSFSSVHENLVQLRQFNIDRYNQFGIPLNGGSVSGPPNDPARTFDINEKSYAGYINADYEFDLGGTIIDGQIGLRAVKTETDTTGTIFTTAGPVPVSFQNSYTDWLPSANLRVQLSPEVQARFAFTQTRTRPSFAQLNPALRLAPAAPCAPGQTNCIRTGSGGNPFLRPLDSDNYDASLEYYFSRTGFASVGVFRRDMQGFIANRAYEFPEPDPETGRTLVISGPINTRDARIKGFEAQVSSFFDFLPGALSGLGAQANVTYIDAKADFGFFCPTAANAECVAGPGAPNATTLRTRIPDVSKWTYNLVGMYERDGLTLRLAYNYRSSFPEADRAERDGFFTLQGRGNSVSRLDWSSSYALTDNFTVFFDWTNILNDPFKSDIVRVNYPGGVPSAEEIFPMVVRQEESVLSAGVRFRF
ncbi:MAG: TonB-dependent receptor [Sphingomonadaceae bacterium]|nr:TonB-dependent receptor [Sphingomonadaceae bacterium]